MPDNILYLPRSESVVQPPSGEEQERRNTLLFGAVVLVLVMYALTGSQILISVAAAFGLLYLVPAEHMRKMLGTYLLFSDLLFSAWLASIAAMTLGGLQIAIVAGLSYTLITRELRRAWGYQELAINGETAFGRQMALLSSQAIAWGKALLTGAKNGTVVAPPALRWEWVEKDAGGGFAATNTAKFLKLGWEKIRAIF